MIRAVDCSAWTGPIPWQTWLELKVTHGVRLAIVQLYGGGPGGTGPNPSARQQLQGALAMGVATAGYCWPPSAYFAALEQAAYHSLAFLALDVEAGARVERAHADGVAGLGRDAWIYTSRSQWKHVMGDSLDFADLPLWDALYPSSLGPGDWPQDLHDIWTPYGGWSRRAAWQWHDTITINGESFDLNVVDSALILGG